MRDALELELERRIEEVSRAEELGRSLTAADVRLLLVLTVLVPIVLLVVGWYAT
jgi:hypothetical protein